LITAAPSPPPRCPGDFIEDRLGQQQLAAVRARGMGAHADYLGMWVVDDGEAQAMVSHLDGRDPCSLRKYMATLGAQSDDAAAVAEEDAAASDAAVGARASREFRCCGECCGCVALREASRECRPRVRASLQVQPQPGARAPRGYCGPATTSWSEHGAAGGVILELSFAACYFPSCSAHG
jgi:hypothetical protein